MALGEGGRVVGDGLAGVPHVYLESGVERAAVKGSKLPLY
jgi:hypothetical protein